MKVSLTHKILGFVSGLLVMMGCGNSGKVLESKTNVKGGTSIYDLSIPSLDGNETIQLSSFKGKKLLIVNVASKCGFTPQYEGLQKLYEAKKGELQIIGFPCNQFLGQEPGSSEDIAKFCSVNYGVTFPLTSKINVKGDGQHEIYQWLTSKELNGKDDYSVSWNFNKFLIDENGNLIEHFGSKVEPMSDEILSKL